LLDAVARIVDDPASSASYGDRGRRYAADSLSRDAARARTVAFAVEASQLRAGHPAVSGFRA
jgi:hypothetical protein